MKEAAKVLAKILEKFPSGSRIKRKQQLEKQRIRVCL